ncbi:MAG: hypothetical protein JSW11_13165 [Candidatus Heimdallarchaeota archaeon]|nr:MAG: hypothetical protein JSW11_13165 [Candidatus Heimdallarchaeota archaeon]
MLEILTGIIFICLEVILSVQFGALLITFGSILYAPSGSRIGKFCLLTGLFIFTLHNLKVSV